MLLKYTAQLFWKNTAQLFWKYTVQLFWKYTAQLFWKYAVQLFWKYTALLFWKYTALLFWKYTAQLFWKYTALLFWKYTALLFWKYTALLLWKYTAQLFWTLKWRDSSTYTELIMACTWITTPVSVLKALSKVRLFIVSLPYVFDHKWQCFHINKSFSYISAHISVNILRTLLWNITKSTDPVSR